MGAWIEMACCYQHTRYSSVAPCVGAWIEIILTLIFKVSLYVAPCVGAWIEIRVISSNGACLRRRSLRGSVD